MRFVRVAKLAYSFLLFIVFPFNIASSQAVPVIPPKGDAKNAPMNWVSFDSRETAFGPILEVEFDDATKLSMPVVADSVLISYLSMNRYGKLPRLTLNMSDANRFILRFDSIPGNVRKAELVLTATTPAKGVNIPLPPQPFDVELLEVKEAWHESNITWENQPAINENAVCRGIVDSSARELRIDVTSLAKQLSDPKAFHHGWLVRVASPMKGFERPPGSGAPMDAEILKLFDWADSIAMAREQAQTEQRLVLAVVRATHDEASHFSEQMLIATTLADPDVRRLIEHRFVPVRVRYASHEYLRPQIRKDPLVALGTNIANVKAPALVVSTADGTFLARWESIGTFDRDAAHRFLLDAIAESGELRDEEDPDKLLLAGELTRAKLAFEKIEGRRGTYGLAQVASIEGDHSTALKHAIALADTEGSYQGEARTVAGLALMRQGKWKEAEVQLSKAAETSQTRSTEASYWLGCVQLRLGKVAVANLTWKKLIKEYPDSPDAVRAKARLTWPEAMDTNESLISLGSSEKFAGTEVDRTGDLTAAVERGVEYLLLHQSPEGTWSSASANSMYQVAITALAARSLHWWAGKLKPELGERARRASEKATTWLNQEMTHVAPKFFNSFGAAYLLDYFVDLEETQAAVRGDVKTAIQLLQAGQLENGAWSYDLNFGTHWKGGFSSWPKTELGRAHSVNTAQAMLALLRARTAGFDVNVQSLERGEKVLLAMRERPGVYTYTYPEPRNFIEKPEYSIGRASLCEHVLKRLAVNDARDLDESIQLFMTHREELHPVVKLTGGWMSKVRSSSYFYFYAYEHAARAIIHLGVDEKERLALLRDDILQVSEADGSWVDYEAIGKPYGTAMALYVLYLAGS